MAANMRAGLVLLALSCLSCTLVVGAEEPTRFSFHGKVIIPPDVSHERFVKHTRVVLDGGAHVGFLKRDGSFEIKDLPSASYLLEVYSPDYMFKMHRVDLSKKFQDNVRISDADLIGGQSIARIPYDDTYGLVMQPMMKVRHFEKVAEWNLRSMLMNPTLLMMGMPMLLMWLMPKMMEGMDKEQLEEMQKNQQQMGLGGAAGGGGFDLANTLAQMSSGGGKSPTRKKLTEKKQKD